LPPVRVVLVRPESPVNVGAAARIVRNTGLSGLDLVEPGDWRTVECWRTAWGAHEVLEQARVFADLASAVASAGYVLAFTGRREKGVPTLDVREAAAEIAGLAPDDEAALVFGPETSGLTQDELALCGRRAFIPSHPDQPSLNLSHAVMVAAYEVFRAGGRTPPGSRRASHAEKEALLGLLRDGLLALQALPADDALSYFREWRALVQRADLTPRELRLLEHMARKMARG
jgi:TrmH family RNA methyltransferase